MSVPYDKTRKYRLLDEVGFKKHFQADSWEDYNRQFFDGLAPKYDSLNEVLSLGQHRRIKRDIAGRLRLLPMQRVLDLCTGSGDMAIMIAKMYPQCEVVGVDVSKAMLDIARRRAEGLSNVVFMDANVMDLPFEDRSFDVCLISFGLRNLDDLKQGIREMKRITKIRGRVINLDLGRPEKPFLRWVHTLYFQKIVPFLGKTLFHRGEFNSFHYLPASGKYFPSQTELTEIFRELGLQSIERRDYMLGAISCQTARVP